MGYHSFSSVPAGVLFTQVWDAAEGVLRSVTAVADNAEHPWDRVSYLTVPQVPPLRWSSKRGGWTPFPCLCLPSSPECSCHQSALLLYGKQNRVQ